MENQDRKGRPSPASVAGLAAARRLLYERLKAVGVSPGQRRRVGRLIRAAAQQERLGGRAAVPTSLRIRYGQGDLLPGPTRQQDASATGGQALPYKIIQCGPGM